MEFDDETLQSALLRLGYLEAISAAVADRTAIFELISSSADRNNALDSVGQHLGIAKHHAQTVLDLPLTSFTVAATSAELIEIRSHTSTPHGGTGVVER